MTNIEYSKKAQEVLYQKLGFKVAIAHITLLEGGDNGRDITYMAFRRSGYDRIEYRATYNVADWDMQIIDVYTKESIYL